MSNPLEQLRNELMKKQKAQDPANRGSGGDNALYPFWNAKDGTTSVIRFLPDGNQDNPFFWRERRVIELTFDGILGDNNHNGKTIKVTVPCMKMYDNTLRCPILEEINKYWKTDLEDTARKYWPKKSYLMQGFVREAPEFVKGKEDNSPENPIRRFTINKKLFENIEKAILDPDMENLPTDFENGSDFRIAKTQQGEYASYSTSTFARKESPLTQDELAAVEEYGLNDLNDFIPRRPSEDGIAVIEEMFNASLNGEPYNPEWAEFYKPYGIDFGNTSSGGTSPKSTNAPSKSKTASSNDDGGDEEQEQSKPAPSKKADDVLAQLRNRINKQQ